MSVVRLCEHCGRCIQHGAPDPCLGEIPGVSHACCGHGVSADAYVVLGGTPNEPASRIRRLVLRRQAAVQFFNLLRLGAIHEPPDAEPPA